MCVQAAVALATSVVSFAAADADYNNRAEQWKQNYVNALASGRDEQRQLQIRMIQEQAGHQQQQQLAEIEGAEVGAEAEVSAAAGGVSGISLDNILTGINQKIATKQAAEDTNYMNTVAQLGESLKATNTNIENRINSVAKPTAPNPLGYALQGIGGALKSME
ncbi:hypothetical protein [Rhizobium sp. CECT 9324]|uniref:virion core protein, T7 gp14 family n=1 Tax=Rhizobium sp. CECT 9324 TaxID=2845820 RepID=UPI001E51B9EE|nr:hypothetical protein [Rhizobium sp. CECT 9324]CAH0343716.1 hypothetical protein RHI9324_05453 [Rhizobium sp. CECT 9324]